MGDPKPTDWFLRIDLEKAMPVAVQTVLSVVDGMGVFGESARDILKKNGITDPQPGTWYKQQDWLNAFRQISEQVGKATLFAIGKKIPENAQFPPQINNLETALNGIDMAYHMNHRKGEIGHYLVKSYANQSAVMVCENPYPCDFDRGIIVAMATRFKPETSLYIRVTHDDSQPCRKKGDDSCTYKIAW